MNAIRQRRIRQRRPQVRFGGIGPREQQIVAHAACNQHGVLGRPGEMAAQRVGRQPGDVRAADGDDAG